MAKNSTKTKSVSSAGSHAGEHASAKKNISQAEAVRQAIAAGKDLPSDGTDFIMTNYGIDMTNQTFSSYKSQQKIRDNKQNGHSSSGPKSSQGVEGYLAPPSKRSLNGETDVLEALEAVKPLIAQHGVEQLKRMVDLLG